MADDLDIGIDIMELLPQTPRIGAGRQAKPLMAQYERPLTEGDLAMPSTVVATAPPLKEIRAAHHALARVLATGSSNEEASAITGYSPSRISILKADPTFAELVKFYESQGAEVVADFRQRMATVGITALELLQEKLLAEDADELSAGLLKDIAKDMADRTGHAPQKGGGGNGAIININLGEQMARARERVQARVQKVIDHE